MGPDLAMNQLHFCPGCYGHGGVSPSIVQKVAVAKVADAKDGIKNGNDWADERSNVVVKES